MGKYSDLDNGCFAVFNFFAEVVAHGEISMDAYLEHLLFNIIS